MGYSLKKTANKTKVSNKNYSSGNEKFQYKMHIRICDVPLVNGFSWMLINVQKPDTVQLIKE